MASLVIFDIGLRGHSDAHSVRMSKITNDCLTRSGTGCFTHTATLGVIQRVNLENVTYVGIVVKEFSGLLLVWMHHGDVIEVSECKQLQ